MILVPGRSAISVVLPQSARSGVVAALLLPLLTGMAGQRYLTNVFEPQARSEVREHAVAASLVYRPRVAEAARAAMASVANVTRAAGASVTAMTSVTRANQPVSTVSAALNAREARRDTRPQEPALAAAAPPSPAEATAVTEQPAGVANVLDVKAMLRTLAGLRRGTVSPAEVARIPRSGLLRLEALHLNEAISVHPFNDNEEPDREALSKIDHLMRCRITSTEVPIDPRLVEILVRLDTLYGRGIQLISGHRQPDTIGTKKTSQHTLGRAADIRIPGVGAEELKRVALKLGARGVGLYPEKGFVHIDVRPSRYTWTYTAANGEQSDARAARIAARPAGAPIENVEPNEPEQGEPGEGASEEHEAQAAPEPAGQAATPEHAGEVHEAEHTLAAP